MWIERRIAERGGGGRMQKRGIHSWWDLMQLSSRVWAASHSHLLVRVPMLLQ
jgi:hypothetical protein